MNTDVRQFVWSVFRVVIPTLFVVASTAFVTVPYTLGHHPGDTAQLASASARHMT